MNNSEDTQRITRFVNALSKQTEAKTLAWSDALMGGMYQTRLGNYSVQIYETTDKESGEDYIEITVRGLTGKLLETIYPSMVDELALEGVGPAYRVFENLYKLARRQASGADEALDELIKVLEAKA